MKLFLFILFFPCIAFAQQNQILVLGNYEDVCLNDSIFITGDSLPDSLQSVHAIMLFSGASSKLTEKDIERIDDFVQSGGGLYTGADNWPLQAESNQITTYLYKKQSFGNYQQEVADPNPTEGNLELTKLKEVPAGKTIVAFPLDYRLKVEAWVHDQPLILTGNHGQGRIIIDGGYSRFYCDLKEDSSEELLQQFVKYLLQN